MATDVCVVALAVDVVLLLWLMLSPVVFRWRAWVYVLCFLLASVGLRTDSHGFGLGHGSRARARARARARGGAGAGDRLCVVCCAELAADFSFLRTPQNAVAQRSRP